MHPFKGILLHLTDFNAWYKVYKSKGENAFNKSFSIDRKTSKYGSSKIKAVTFADPTS